MPKINLPRASWEDVLLGLQILCDQGYLFDSVALEIHKQVYSQEY